MEFQSLSDTHSTFSTLAEVALRDMILSGKIPGGARINEVQIAGALEVSRGPLREAIQRLASQGLLTVKSHRGAFVTVITLERLRELYELRIALETFALRSAFLQTNGEGLDELRRLFVSSEELQASDAPEEHAIYLHFHDRIVSLSGNSELRAVHHEVLIKIAMVRARSVSNREHVRHALNEHTAVLDACLRGDADAAVELLESHLRSSFEAACLNLDPPPS